MDTDSIVFKKKVTFEHCLTVTGLHKVVTMGAHDLFGSGLKNVRNYIIMAFADTAVRNLKYYAT